MTLLSPKQLSELVLKKSGYNFSKHHTYVVADRTDASFVVQDIKYALPAKVRHKSIKFNFKLN